MQTNDYIHINWDSINPQHIWADNDYLNFYSEVSYANDNIFVLSVQSLILFFFLYNIILCLILFKKKWQ